MFAQRLALAQAAFSRAPEKCLPIQPPAHSKRYAKLVPGAFRFDASQGAELRIVLGTECLDLPLRMADVRVLALAEARCKQMMREFVASGSFRDWISMMLRETEDCQPTQEDLARILNMSVRTLDRQLAKEGSSFRALTQSVRNERAREMLADGRQPISQIAFRLGYTDTANLSRWFGKMNGLTPSDFIEQRHQGGA